MDIRTSLCSHALKATLESIDLITGMHIGTCSELRGGI